VHTLLTLSVVTFYYRDLNMSIVPALVFDGKSNFLNWAHQVSFQFDLETWNVVIGKTKRPEDISECESASVQATHKASVLNWSKLNREALAKIFCLLKNDVVTNLRNLNTAYEVWTRLHVLYTKGTSQHVQSWKQKLYNFKMLPNETIDQMQSRLEDIVSNLDRLNSPISDEDKVGFVLNTIHDKFPFFPSAWESVATAEQTFSNLIARLLREESRLPNKGDDSNNVALLTTTKNDKFRSCNCTHQDSCSLTSKSKNTCSYCNKQGHSADRCYKRKNDLKQKSKPSAKSRQNSTNTSNYSSAFAAIVSNSESERWIADNGATDHLTHRRDWFLEYESLPAPHPVRLGDRQTVSAVGIGSVEANTPFGRIII
jgi:hypothetical protein